MTTERLTQLPPLESGDRLTRTEFERRYAAMPRLKKAELIEGVVYVASPLRYRSHGQPHLFINTWLGTYCAATPGVGAADTPTVRLDADNEPQPDALLRDETYQALAPNSDGVFRSFQFPGLWLARNDLLSGHLAAVLNVLQQGLATPEHQAFVEHLQQSLL